MEKTNKYQLPQWTEDDRIMMADFNDAMASIEAGLSRAQETADALRGLQRSTASKAEGTIRFGVSDVSNRDLEIPAGTVCMTGEGIRFSTEADAVLPAGELYVDVPAIALEAGSHGNVPATAIVYMAAMPVGISACTNPTPFSGGKDGEDDEALRARLLDTYYRLPNGANTAYYEQTALSFPGVAAATAVGRPRGVGSVDVYVTAPGGIPEAELLAEIQEHLQQKREISVDLRVVSPAPATVDISLAITPAQGCTFAQAKNDVQAAIYGIFTGELLGRGLSLAQLGDTVYHLDSVANYRIASPVQDLTPSPTVLPVLGELTILEMEV